MLALIAYAATEGAAPGGLAALGFDWKSLVFQVLNFAIILFVLRLVAYKPILKVLESRRQKIEESLKAGSEMEGMKKALVQEKNQIIKQAQTEVQQMLNNSREQAEQIVKNSQKKAQEQTQQMVEKARTQSQQELQGLHDQFKKEAVSLVAMATEHIIAEKLDPKADEAFITRVLAEAEKKIS